MITSAALTLLTEDMFSVRYLSTNSNTTTLAHVITFNSLSQIITDVDMSLSCLVFVLSVFHG